MKTQEYRGGELDAAFPEVIHSYNSCYCFINSTNLGLRCAAMLYPLDATQFQCSLLLQFILLKD